MGAIIRNTERKGLAMASNSDSANGRSIERFWEKLFGGYGHHTRREEKVLEYICHRIHEGAHLENVLQEDYVRRNCSQGQIDEIISDPRLVHEARLSLEHEFESGELDPDSSRNSR